MGVPAFYRWLSEKYPKIVTDVLEDRVHLASDDGSIRVPFDSTRPNPSGLECDNLYIDMNGIIHPCSHPENGPQPANEIEMYENVCRYVDRLFRATRPRRMLYLAIDGVAPRAKMNQQRARRFRSAQEAREAQEVEDTIREQLAADGSVRVPPKKKGAWDSNVITPGTRFMLNLSEYIRFYIRKRISTDKAWRGIRVIFSDASVPGEGEHKIMAHVRLQRSQPNYDPNVVHVLHGLDADLIMLALATHEAHFYILREEVIFGRKGQEETERRREETGFADAQRQLDEEAGASAMELLENKGKPLQRLSVPILREYLANEFKCCANVPFREVSFERLVDDIVFLCFFVGNDFLPHLPSLDIRVGALDFLFNVYKRILPTLGDYITNHGGEVNLSRVDVILAEVGAIEDHVFLMKHEADEAQKRRREQRKARNRSSGGGGRGGGKNPPPPPPFVANSNNEQGGRKLGRAARILSKGNDGAGVALGQAPSSKEVPVTDVKPSTHKSKEENEKAAELLREGLKSVNGVAASEASVAASAPDPGHEDEEKERNGGSGDVVGFKRSADSDDKKEPSAAAAASAKDDVTDIISEKLDEEDEVVIEVEVDLDDEVDESDGDEDEVKQAALDEGAQVLKDRVKVAQEQKLDSYAKNVVDNVRLHEAGWKDRYYKDKCKADDVAEHGGREHLFRSYVMGLCWVMKYYYDGVPSWKWFFPFHYAPFASDLRNIERFAKDCSTFEENEPFRPVEQLMAVLPEDSSHAVPKASRWLMSDVESPIIDFYPKEVKCDPNGKAMPWLWVVLLPFIEEDRLLAAMEPTRKDWSPEENLCNARGLDDGYVFVHASHPLAEAAKKVLMDESNKKAAHKALCSIAAGKCPEFAGSIRQPLSNEMHTVDDGTKLPPPASSSRITRDSHDGLFTDTLEQNLALCIAFCEPTKKPHRSVVLPRAVPPPPLLSPEDKVIRRPKLSFGGGTIANLGGHNRSHRVGYGSMNISSYERELAQRTGRGAQMNQAGTRAWGAMEPTAKRQRYNGGGQAQGGYRPNQWQQQQQQQQHHQYQQQHQQHYRPQLYAQQQPQQQHQQQQLQNSAGWPQQQGSYRPAQPWHQPPAPPPSLQLQQSRGRQQDISSGRRQQQHQQGYSFQGYNRHSQQQRMPPYQNHGQRQHHPSPQQQQQQQQQQQEVAFQCQSTPQQL